MLTAECEKSVKEDRDCRLCILFGQNVKHTQKDIDEAKKNIQGIKPNPKKEQES